MPETNARIKVCHDTAANFKTNNPTLLVGEWALETDTKKMKIGDGSSAYNSLPYSTAEEDDEWRKPADWIDIRSGALPNSVYLLIGHSADYSTYPEYAFVAETTDTSQTFDVYIDGVKIGSYASGSTVTLNWQTLALQTGYNVTYPSALRTHIVRVTPTEEGGTFRQFYTKHYSANTDLGVLWAHLTFNEGLWGQVGFLGENGGKAKFPICEAVTTSYDCLKFNAYGYFFYNCYALKTAPVLDGTNFQTKTVTYNLLPSTFQNCYVLKKVHLQNMDFIASERGQKRGANSSFLNCYKLEEIIAKNCIFLFGTYVFVNVEILKKIPETMASPSSSVANRNHDMVAFIKFEYGHKGNLDPFYLDFTNTYLTRIYVQGNSAYTVPLKGIVFSSNSTFSGGSPQIDLTYTGLNRQALVTMFNSLPTVSGSQVCNITGATGANDLTAEDLAIATDKGWTVTR